jgi:hypothetical protein
VPSSEKDAAVALISSCLQLDPQDRPQSIEEMLSKSHYFHSQSAGVLTAKLLFVSTPGKGFDPKTGEYSFDVMGWLQELCRRYIGRFVVAYDWAGSSSADPRDQQWFDRIFEAPKPTLFDQWKAAQTVEEKDIFVDAVHKLLDETRWLSSYKGSIKAQIRETCQSGAKAILVRLEGGPITRVEARVMGQLISEVKADLAQLGVADPDLELHAFGSATAFADSGLSRFLRDIYGEDHYPIPESLLAALPHENPAGSLADASPATLLRSVRRQGSATLACGARVNHPLRGEGSIWKLDWDDPRGHTVQVLYDTGEIHHYTSESALRKLKPLYLDEEGRSPAVDQGSTTSDDEPACSGNAPWSQAEDLDLERCSSLLASAGSSLLRD